MNKKVACVTYFTDDRYDELSSNVKNSFSKFHANEADYIQIDYTNHKDYFNKWEHFTETNDVGLNWMIHAYEIMIREKYTKIILLGCDTIVCDRLSEFIDDDSTPVLATLNYYIHEETEYWSTPIIKYKTEAGEEVIDHLNINSDVICFNSPEALRRVIELTIECYTIYTMQGGVNHLAWTDKSFDVKIVDSPYENSKVSYNVRSKGVPRADMIENGKLKNCWPHNIHGFPYEWLAQRDLIDGYESPIKKWYIKDNKLFTHDHKQIKCFHFVEGLGGRPLEKFNYLIQDFKLNWFNKETIQFFKEQCNCNTFFK